MAILSELDLELYNEMLNFEILIDTTPVYWQRRAVEVGCPDCDKLKDKLLHHGTKIRQKLHPAGLIHGGAAGFHQRSPLNNNPVPFPWEWYCQHIKEGFEVKHTKQVAWYIHAPCSKAYAVGLNLAQLVELQFTNRGYFIEHMERSYVISGMEVNPYLHMDLHGVRGNKIRRTHSIDLHAWIERRHRYEKHLNALPYRLPLMAAA